MAWLVPGWVFFELFGAKLAHYPMPMYPALALLTARGVVAAEAGGLGDLASRGARFGLWIWNGIGVMLGFAVAVMGVMFAPEGGAITMATCEAVVSIVAGLVVVGLVVQARRRAARGNWAGSTRLGLAAGVVFVAGFMVFPARKIVPTTGVLTAQVAGAIAAELGEAGREWGANVVRDSAVFQTRGTIVRVEPDGAVEWLRGGAGRVYVQEVGAREEPVELAMPAESEPGTPSRMLYRAMVRTPMGNRAVVYFIREVGQAALPGAPGREAR